MLIIKATVNLLCCLIPKRRWRKKIRNILIDREKGIRKKLLDYGCGIENEIITTPEGVKMNIFGPSRETLGLIEGVFLNKEYDVGLDCDAVLIDIGLNLGIVSLFFSLYPNIRKIYSYEPFKPTFERAKKNIQLNPNLGKKIDAFNFGLGKSDLTLELPYIDDRTGKMSTTYDVCKDQENVREETVYIKDAARVIKSILEENKNKCIIVKCDCEGAEFEIFERLDQENLVAKLDVIVMEYHFKEPCQLIDVMINNGFVVSRKSSLKNLNMGYIFAVRMTKK
jgi:FkbM family methyltransferase